MNHELQLLIAVLSLASAVVGLYASLRQVKTSRVETMHCDHRLVPRPDQRPPAQGVPTPVARWYDHPGWILFWLFAFWPVGLFALARSRMIGTTWKKALFGGLGLLVVLAMLGG